MRKIKIKRLFPHTHIKNYELTYSSKSKHDKILIKELKNKTKGTDIYNNNGIFLGTLRKIPKYK